MAHCDRLSSDKVARFDDNQLLRFDPGKDFDAVSDATTGLHALLDAHSILDRQDPFDTGKGDDR